MCVGGGGGPNRILCTENFKNPVADYQHKNYLAPTPPPLPPGVDHAQSRPRPAPITPRPPKKNLTAVRKILDPPLGNMQHKPKAIVLIFDRLHWLHFAIEYQRYLFINMLMNKIFPRGDKSVINSTGICKNK